MIEIFGTLMALSARQWIFSLVFESFGLEKPASRRTAQFGQKTMATDNDAESATPLPDTAPELIGLWAACPKHEKTD